MHKWTVAFGVLAVGIALTIPPIGVAAGDLTNGPMNVAAADLDHGRKLYDTACDACHKVNVHWRDKSIVDSWAGLLQQVERWQRNAGQRWEAADIKDVAAYLNERFYRLKCPANECSAKAAALTPAVPR